MNSQRLATLVLFLGLVTAVILLSPGTLLAGKVKLWGKESEHSEDSTTYSPYLVKDIFPDITTVAPICFASLGDDLICTSYLDGVPSLWKSDGTQAGTTKLAEVGVLYPDSSYEPRIREYKGHIYFASIDGLWRTNGTMVGTELFDDRPDYNVYAQPDIFAQAGDLLYFLSYDEPDYLLWRTDGHKNGTWMIGTFADPIHELTAFKEQLFFTSGGALWQSDGTAKGTIKVKDISPKPVNLTVVGNQLYMGTEYNGHLWLSDGTAEGTKLFADEVHPTSLVSFQGQLYYWTRSFISGADDGALWRTDGTPESTQRIVEALVPYGTVTADSLFYFFPDLGRVPATLWRSDGTLEGTFSLNATFPDTNYDNFFKRLLTAGNRLYFAGYDETNGTEPWTSDGSEAGTTLIKDVHSGVANSNPYSFHMLGDKVYFRANSNHSALWSTNGNPDDTKQVVAFTFHELHRSEPNGLTAVGDKLFFSARDGNYGRELWISDGRVTGTNLVKDLTPGTESSSLLWGYPGGADLGGELLFTANDGQELWKSDGSEAGTIPIWNLAESETSNLTRIWAGETVAYLFTKNGLWATNGQAAGQIQLLETDGFPVDQVVNGDRLYVAIYYSGETSLVTSTGTPASTIQLFDGPVDGLCMLDGMAYFAAGDTVYQSDGTVSGTNPVVTLTGVEIKDLACSVDKLFISNDGESGWSLWVSDGSQIGTTLIKSVEFEADDERIYSLIPFGKGVIFKADDGIHGFEPWISNGTGPGTHMVQDIYPGTNSSSAEWITPVEEVAFFNANDGAHGTELWVTNGTEDGTYLVKDIVPPGQGGPYWCSGDGSCPSKLTVSGNRLFFWAEEGDGDVELWALDLILLPPAAEFSAVPTSGFAPLQVSLKNLSSGVVETCSWDFGDGNTEMGCSDQTHTYSDSSVYSVSLSINGPGGEDSLTRETYINTDIEAVTADISVSPTAGIAPLTINIVNQSEGDFDTCSWSFGDGETAAGCEDKSHTYGRHGVFTVSLTVDGLGGINRKIISEAITVYEPVSAGFQATPTSGLPPLVVSFDNQSKGDFETCAWDFGDGQKGSDCTGQKHIYTTPGVYDVSLTVSGRGGTNEKILSNAISIFETVKADLSASPRSGLPPLTVNFTNLSSGTYDNCSWNFGDGNTSTICEDPKHTYTHPGKFQVRLTVNGPGGEDIITKEDFILIENMFQSFLPSVLRK